MLNKKITAQDFADILYEAVQGVELVLQKGDMNGVLITEAANIQGVYYPLCFSAWRARRGIPVSKNRKLDL